MQGFCIVNIIFVTFYKLKELSFTLSKILNPSQPMSNINAQLRYQVIDQRLRHHMINYWKDLAEACAIAHEESSGTATLPSQRTINYDIARMRSGQLGYEAPIEYKKELGYYYSDRSFSIYRAPISKLHADKLVDAFLLLKQLTKNEKFLNIHQALTILEDTLRLDNSHLQAPIIFLEHSLNEIGQKWLDTVYDCIKKKTTVRILYIPFDQPECERFVSPIFIKEYNNRWYLYGYDHELDTIINLGLDRISAISSSLRPYFIPADFSYDDWFGKLYGVTKPIGTSPVKITFETTDILSKYMISKPIHHSQKLEVANALRVTFSLEVFINYEIIHKLLGFGADLLVIHPAEVVDILSEKCRLMHLAYQ